MNIKDQKVQLLTFAIICLGLCLAPYSIRAGEHDKSEARVFIIHAPITNLDEFRELVKQATSLKPYGRVEINISTLADKGFHEIPAGRNFWYEYASNNPTPFKFFPDPKISPFIPAEYVRKNRELLLAKAKILKKYGMDAAFWSYEPNFLPDAFYEAYPHIMGPRVDHPRRSNHPAFAPCISVEETREMYRNMVAELLKNVPDIHSFFFKTNDAGSGICWSDWLYSGPNGPVHCKNKSVGTRVESLMNTFKEGAELSGEDISIYLVGSMFTDDEKKDIYNHLPEKCYFQSQNSGHVRTIGSGIGAYYPVRGMIDLLAFVRNMHAIEKDSVQTIFINFRASYDRGYERLDVIDRYIDMMVACLNDPPKNATYDELQELRRICKVWGGKQSEELLFKAFIALDEAAKYKREVVGGVSALYWGVSVRHVTRPLVIAPQLLTCEEEIGFMPYVFNPSEEAARMDYTDIHGTHRIVAEGTVNGYVSRLKKVIDLMDRVNEDAPAKEFIRNMATGLRIYSSIMRSAGNFGAVQAIRDRNAEKLNAMPHRPDKIPTWEGDPDLQKFNQIMRDELDNTQDLIDILNDGGMESVCHAKDKAHEDTFLLGPDLIEQLKMKRKIMLRHWTDIEGYLATPLK